jgi:hypothetical protein
MNAGCWCKGHDLEGRQIYDMHEIDPEQNEVGDGGASYLTDLTGTKC